MAKERKKGDKSDWAIPAFLFIGLGIGFLLIEKLPLAIPAFTLIGLGVGFLFSYLSRKKK